MYICLTLKKKVMKQLFAIFIFTIACYGCGNGVEKKAEIKLQLAKEALAGGDFTEAKTQIDSIKILYPKAFKARKEGIRLKQQVELKEQNQAIDSLTSALVEKEKEFETLKSKFTLEKDAEYQEIGNYFWPTQTVEKNLHRSFLRFQVNERGEMIMTSIYCGARSIHHQSVKVIAPDGTFAETPASKDSYDTTDLGENIEKADYKLGEDGNVIEFLYTNRDNNIKVEYLGERKYTTTMSVTDRKALSEIYELTQLLTSIEQIKKELKEANLKREFVQRNIEKSQTDSIS